MAFGNNKPINTKETEKFTTLTSSTEKERQNISVDKEYSNQEFDTQLEGSVEKNIDKIPSSSPDSSSNNLENSTSNIVPKSINLQQIENILSDDLDEIYFKMDSAHRQLFKEEGERIAHEIEQILIIGKSVTVKILELIKRWLRLVPGLNKFFIEQEAKIKTDKIFKLNHS